MKKFAALIALAAAITGCAVSLPNKTTDDLLADRDKMDVARCAGTSSPDLSKFTAEQYQAYTACIVELDKRRSAR
ncbi:hypothetical protein ACWYXJ_29235 [Janthinobacterium lividum]